MSAPVPSSVRFIMSPGSFAATATSPPCGARKVLMKKVSPPSTERLRPPRTPPWAFVSISTPLPIAAMPPASTLIASPGAIEMTP